MAANRLANAYLDYLFTAEITEVEEVQVGGILPPDAPVASSIGMLSVRALTAEELGTNLRRMFGIDECLANDDMPPSFGGLSDGLYNIVDYAMGCMLTIRRKVARNSALEQEPRLRQIVLAFQLLGHSIFGRGVAPRWTEPGPRWGSAPELIHLPQFPEFEERPVTSDVLDEVSSLADLIPLTFAQPKHRSEVALNQFSGACAQKSDADAVIGFTIALETIFVPGLLGENAYRFRLNGARYLGAIEQERHEIYEHLKTLYQVRSKLVHGAPPQESELRDARMIARRLAARALSKALKGGWPTGKDFEKSALS